MRQQSILATAGGSAALLIGFGVLMVGDGLQMTLLGLRASLDGFPTAVTGLVMSTFYVGFLGGALYAPRIVERVGHIRVFGALASCASAAVLIHSVMVTPVTWAVLRLLSGFCFAGLFVVTESWLNDRASNENRGQLLSIYIVVSYVGVAAGQLMLNVADPRGYVLFILTSVLISLALVPLLLSAGPAPKFAKISVVSVRELFRISPLGVVGAAGIGMASGAFFSIGPVFGESTGMSVARISVFMTAAVVGCIALQWPVGRLSDLFDRRRVLTIVTFLAALAAVLATLLAERSPTGFLIVTGLFGGLSFSMYSLCIAHANDYLDPEQMVAASGGLVLANGVGAILGPITVSLFMWIGGPVGFFACLAGVHAGIGGFAIYRMIKRPAVPMEEQAPYAPTTTYSSQATVELAQHEMHDQLTDDGDSPQ